MKNAALIAKILTAVAAIVGAAYLIATYGEQVVAWAKKLLATCPCKCTAEDCANCECELDCPVDDDEIDVDFEVEEDLAAEEVPVIEVEEPAVDVTAPVAEEADFEG